MNPKRYTHIIYVALVLFVGLIAETANAQTKTRRSAEPRAQTLTTTGTTVREDDPADEAKSSPSITLESTNPTGVPAIQLSDNKRSNTTAAKIWLREFAKWVKETPNALQQLDDTERKLFESRKGYELYEYRKAKTLSNNN